MSDFSVTDLHDSLPPEVQLSFDLHGDVVQQQSTIDGAMPLDGQPPVERPPEFLDHGVQQHSFSDNAMPLSHEAPLEQLLELPDDDAKQGTKTDTAMDIDDQPAAGQPPHLYSYGTQGDIVFNSADFERDIAQINENAPGWWVQHGGSLHSDGSIDFGSSTDQPHFDFEMDDVVPSIEPTAQTPSAESINPFGLCGLPTNLGNTPTSGQPQQMFAPPDSGPIQYPLPPVTHYPLPYNFDWQNIAERQSRAPMSNAPGHFITNSGTGAVLEVIPEDAARSPGLSFTPVQRPSSVANLNFPAGTLTTPSPSPTLQAASVDRQPPVRRNTVATGTGRTAPTGRHHIAVKFPIYNRLLLVNGLSEAKTMANKRIALDVIDDDDRDLVVARPQDWVPLISKAFESDYLGQPDDGTRLTKEGQAEWTRWQQEHENKVWHILDIKGEEESPKFVQSCAYIFYGLVLEAHEQGKGLPYVGKTISNPGPNINLKCSERINEAIEVLKKFPIVRYDFIRQDRLDGLAANPLGFVNRKIENMWVNYKKKHNTGPVKEEPVKAEPTGKKRTAAEMEQQLDANGLPTGTVSATIQPGPKRTKAAPKKRGSQAPAPKNEAATSMDVKEEDEMLL
jgi:hypothetical protein